METQQRCVIVETFTLNAELSAWALELFTVDANSPVRAAERETAS